ncbi:hypothetical protein C5E45_09965 [Nocardia nova]|uniref:ABC3 transporter permease C-terminal domain-containing protein n=1 Tax=Nocardia nova TaxID=37330 RepID=A0A2S6ATN3_9NOCA|nr:FtsX-like permease family protein [Nocardia nova]PPJ38549.1 hypothetical protein C5E45_09965 [Nocardia nova]
MFLALRELWYARVRFGLMGGVVALISILTVMLSGLSSGLVDDDVSGLRALPVDAFAFAHGTKTDSAFTRSTIDTAQVAAWRSQPGVADAAPFGNTLVNAKTSGGVAVDFALFGVEPQSFLAPEPAKGAGLDRPDGIVVSATALDKAVLRAIGAPTRFLLADGLTQAVVVLVGATAIGVLIAVGGSRFIHGMPFTLDPAAIATGAGLLVLLGVLGAAAAIVRVTRIDPLAALGANR